ncbi:pantetheine-phosphate adenylyltransferase [Candidatus Zixiibacteriota bacterium]
MKVSRLAIYPGTFDPITNGHLDIIRRSTQIFDEIIILIAHNVEKAPLFNIDERLNLAVKVTAGIDQVTVEVFDGLLAEFARQRQATAIVRGLRAVKDFEYEFQMALMNKSLYPEVETVLLMPSERFTYVNSKIVREVARLGGDVTPHVPPIVAEALYVKFSPDLS